MPKKTIFFVIFLTVIAAGLVLPFDSARAEVGTDPLMAPESDEGDANKRIQAASKAAGVEYDPNWKQDTADKIDKAVPLLECVKNPVACVGKFTAKALMAMIYAVMYIMAALFELAGFLVNYAINLNSMVLVHPIVKIGWIVTRDLANLGFVLAIIIIAFTTIVRAAGFDTKQMLVKLIAAAILINFSFVIAGVFMDFAGMLGSYFMDQANIGKKSGADLASAFSNTFNIGMWSSVKDTKITQKEIFNCPDPGFGTPPKDFYEKCPKIKRTIPPAETNKFESIEGDLSKILKMVVSLVFAILFTILGTISFLAIAIMLLVRYVALGMLMILMPIAWLMWILPQTEGMWKQWWGKFMQYVFFFPAVSFFIYLAVAITFFQGITEGVTPKGLSGPGGSAVAMQAGVDDTIAQMILVLGFLIGGLMVSQKLGVAAGGVGLAMAQKAKGGAQNFMKNRATGARDRALSRYGKGASEALARIPGFRGMATRIAGATAGISESVKKMQDAFSKMSKEGLKRVEPGIGASAAKKAAWANAAAGKRALSEADARKYLAYARQVGGADDIEAAFPHLAEDINKATRKADITKMHSSALLDHRVLASLTQGQFKTYVETQPIEEIRGLRDRILEEATNPQTRLDAQTLANLQARANYIDKNPLYQV